MLNDRKQPRLYENPKLTHIGSSITPTCISIVALRVPGEARFLQGFLSTTFFTQPEYKQDIHTHAKYAIQSSFHLPKPLIVRFMYLSKSQEYKNGRCIATYLGNHVRSNWPRFLYIWEKAKSSRSITHRHRSIYLSLFYIERIHACNCGCCFSGATLFCENVRQVTVGECLLSERVILFVST